MIRCNGCGRILSPEDIDEDTGKVKPGRCSCGKGTWLWIALGYLVILGLAWLLSNRR